MPVELTLIHNREHQEKLASEVNDRLRQAAKERRANRERQEGVEIPSRKPSSARRMVEVPESPRFGTSGGYRNRQPIKRTSLTGAEKRRKRKGGKPNGGPGLRGGGMRPSTPSQRRGILRGVC